MSARFYQLPILLYHCIIQYCVSLVRDKGSVKPFSVLGISVYILGIFDKVLHTYDVCKTISKRN